MFRNETVLGGVFKLSNGNFIPLVGLGTWRNTEQKDVDKSVQAALKARYRLIDTAHLYENEEQIGNALEKYLPEFGLQREDVFITTKVPTVNENCDQESRKFIQESLDKLKTEYLDMVLVHYPRDRYTGKDEDHETNRTNREVIWKVLEEYHKKGIIKNIGVANYMNYHLTEMKEYAKVQPVMNQIEFHPYLCQNLVRQQCKEQNMFIQTFSNLGSGHGEIHKEKAVQECAKKNNVSSEIILYAFALCSGGGIVPKSQTPQRINDNMNKVLEINFNEEELMALRELDKNATFTHLCEPWKCL